MDRTEPGSLLEVRVADLRIAYRRAGDGPPLLLLHGILQDSLSWRPQLSGLSSGFTVIAWDAPGAGRSSDAPESFRMAEWADCLAGFMEALRLDRAHVLGLSWGGVLAQRLYARHPGLVSSLILADTYAGWAGSLPAPVVASRLASAVREAELPAPELIARWLPGLLSPAAPAALRADIAEIMSSFHPRGFRTMARAVAEADERGGLSGIRVPTLLVWGDEDARSPLGVAEALRDAIPGAELVVVEGAGHMSNLEQPALFNVAVRRFLASIRG
jgi:pimeloyl-ACP methyl ester carboxylesterase